VMVLDRLKEVGLSTKPSKCQLAMAECTYLLYLGHVVGSGVVKPETSKTEAIAQFPWSETKKDVHSFLELATSFQTMLQLQHH